MTFVVVYLLIFSGKTLVSNIFFIPHSVVLINYEPLFRKTVNDTSLNVHVHVHIIFNRCEVLRYRSGMFII